MSKIPKIIHYCWLSGEPFPEIVEKCINSWKEHMPDYEFILWDTNKFDINSNLYVKQAFNAGKYAFASDYIRLYALYHYGGIYLDSDIYVFKSFDSLLNETAFTGFERENMIAAWIFASIPYNPIFKEFLEYYNNRPFILSNGMYDLTPNPLPITEICLKHGLKLDNTLQYLDYITIYPRTYFCPIIPGTDVEECYSTNTYAQHLFNAGWVEPRQRILLQKKHIIEKKYGRICGLIYYGMKLIRLYGVKTFQQELLRSIMAMKIGKEE